jgi:predicted Zn-dependent peptidase
MNRLKKIHLLLIAIPMVLGVMSSCQKGYKYETLKNDPLNARIYTLENGLKVYMSVYKDEPRIQTYVAVKVGSKHDPSETTGLAHYFEHMMFKGTSNIGTTDWENEKILIEQIENLFEEYRVETDLEKRASIYRIIDSISYEASKLAIPNEYDKMMKFIGSTGTNAGTSNDYTVYIENIPSNQLENWAIIQAERFSNPVLRLFHTELETVYEEKNRSLTNDRRKVGEELYKALFPNHPYGQQTTLGEAEHLKNPSMKNIREFFDKYYVPNNMAIIMSGDFDPEEAIAIIDKEFSTLKRKDVPKLKFENENPIEQPIELEVIGLEAEQLSIGYRFGGASSHEAMMADLLSRMLSNGKTGLIDLNVNLKQRTLSAGAYCSKLADYSSIVLNARNRSGQTLEEAKDILLEQVELLKQGEFPDWMLEATINNLKLFEMKRLESNFGRVWMMSNSFLNDIKWKDAVGYIDELSKVTKDDLVKFAQENLGNNYVVVYKRQGKPDIEIVPKPPITPIHINRNEESQFLVDFKARKVADIEPVFVDFDKDINKMEINGLEVLHKENVENATFSLYYYFPFGRDHDKMINIAADYLQFIGTSNLSAEEIAQEFYKLACSFNVFSSNEETYVYVSGLSENQEKAAELLESLLTDCQPDEEALAKYIDKILKERENAKLSQQSVFNGLVNYATYGAKSPFTNIISNDDLKKLTGETLTKKIKELPNYKHKVLYYGTLNPEELKLMLEKVHAVTNIFIASPEGSQFVELDTDKNRVVFSHYEANQSYLQLVSKSVDYSFDILPQARMYNAYFGGGMNTIVFQELREKRGLAYTARSYYNTPSNPNGSFMNNSFIGTQNDKVIEAFTAFNELFDEMPVSETSFELAKDAIISGIRNQRITKMGVIMNYINAQKMGYKEDIRKTYFETIPNMTIDDVIRFNEQYIKNKPKTYVILGHENVVDFKQVQKKFGPVTKLTREQIFGY